jgi:dTDP-4-dehydrorhamnose 3,5-epimerase-like enzyme
MKIIDVEKHSDQRGWVREIYSGELGASLQNIHLGTMEPGAVRGNHRHDKSREWITFLHGPVKVYLQKNSEEESFTLEPDKTIKFEPEEAHAFENNGKNTVFFIAWRDHLYTDDDPDTKPEKLV